MNRRRFVQQSSAAATGFLLAGSGETGLVDANDQIIMAVVGIHGQGKSHFRDFSSISGVRVKTVCDVDERLFSEALKLAEDLTGREVQFEVDIRRVLDDKEIDAISIATPNHWHSLMTVWACQAGKDVYVEKPVSHNVWEGRQAVEAARRYGRIVATGTQNRSYPHVQEAIRLLHEGVIGEVYMAKGLGFKPRESIGRKPDQPVPSGLHFDLWLGPAPQRAFNENLVHYNWHWFWDFGNGDLGNQGVHQMDIARWGLNKKDLPQFIHSVGGYFAFDSDQETPNTLLATYGWKDGKILQFEVRGLYTNGEDEIRIGNLFYGSEGWMHLDRDGFRTYLGRKNEPGPNMEAVKNKTSRMFHRENFIQALRSRKPEDLTADITEGHLSSALCHLGNIAYRLNRQLEFDSNSERFVDDEQADAYLIRSYRPPFVVPEMTSMSSPGRTLRFAHFGNGGGIASTLVLVNPWEEAVSGEVSLVGSDGSPLAVDMEGNGMNGNFSFSLPARGVAFFRTDGEGELRTGWVEVSSRLALGGTILFTGAFGVAGVGNTEAAQRFLVPVESKADKKVQTGVALTNPEEGPVLVTLILRDRMGEEVANGIVTLELPARGHLARFPEDLFVGQGIDLSDFDGTLEISAPTPVVGTAIRVSPGEFATLPVTRMN
ncbi:Gfo/Idh/MocA family oxidoreductase [Acidobacteria bacterium AH-259-O06]|nr:Gfo/Idh/MocA family oxidoreductase [Acidobacteria bacterium AH-259-O06]